MILQALASYYDQLLSQGQVPRSGWAPVKVSFALTLDEQGRLIDLLPLKEEVQRGKKTVLIPRVYQLPQPVIRTAGARANFLCDNAGYLLGIDGKGKPERTRKCFALCGQLHEQLLSGCDHPAARAVCAYFATWDPAAAREDPVLAPYLDELLAGANLIFRFAGQFLQDIPEIAAVWDSRPGEDEQPVYGRCLVTGGYQPIAQLHNPIKGVKGAQSTGAALVAFNAPSFTSYEKEQSYNAPVGKPAVFAYTTALNYLLADGEHVQHIGDTTVVYWSENAQPAYPDIWGGSIQGESEKFSPEILHAAMEALAQGHTYQLDGQTLEPDVHFYILGLAPNAARLSVRFFYQDTFGALMKNVRQHYRDLEMVRPAFEKFEQLSLSALLYETVNKNARDKSAVPVMAGAVYRAITGGTPYPESLLNSAMLRIRAERRISWDRASIIKAVLLRRQNPPPQLKEVLQVKLNENSSYSPYVLGRIFSVLEASQQEANPNVNATIRDRYFNSAASTPASIFPVLMRLYNAHIKKISNPKHKNHYERQLQELIGKLDETLPARHSLPQQQAFYMGYYHQNQNRYEKKSGVQKTEEDN